MSGTEENWGRRKKNDTPNTPRVNVDDFLGDGGVLREVDKKSIYPDPMQPRVSFDQDELLELQNSIEKNGMLQPILVCEAQDNRGGKYKIITGERRWRAVMASNKLHLIQVVIRNDLIDDLKILLAQIAENEHRANMNVLETANAYQRVLDAVDGDAVKATDLLNVSASRFSLVLGLNKSKDSVRKLAENQITNDAHVLASLNTLTEINEDKANQLINKIEKGELKGGGVRKATNDMVQEEKKLSLLEDFSGANPVVKALISEGITTNVNLLKSLDELYSLDKDKGDDYIGKFKSGDLNSNEVLKYVNKEITQARKTANPAKKEQANNDIELISRPVVTDNKQTKIIKIDAQLLSDLTSFLKGNQDSEYNAMIKQVILLFESAKSSK